MTGDKMQINHQNVIMNQEKRSYTIVNPLIPSQEFNSVVVHKSTKKNFKITRLPPNVQYQR